MTKIHVKHLSKPVYPVIVIDNQKNVSIDFNLQIEFFYNGRNMVVKEL